jgi:hypothetical protein
MGGAKGGIGGLWLIIAAVLEAAAKPTSSSELLALAQKFPLKGGKACCTVSQTN